MIWMFDTDTLICLINRKPRFERIVRRMSGRSPGELRLSAITLSELSFGVANGEFRSENEQVLGDLLAFLQADDFPCGAAQDFGDIKVSLASKGALIGPYDLLIAAHRGTLALRSSRIASASFAGYRALPFRTG
jgi:tRNA(fMet)-specific endonuclease VapC